MSKKLIGGYSDSTFKPNQYITRAEASHIINNALNRKFAGNELLSDIKTWPDCHRSDWYYEDIQEATNGHLSARDSKAERESWVELKNNNK